ncbi:hypothetical protein ACH5RR_023529 [Cinchona calisaya]|uniref:Flotillin-like n=1 Tax=Cinchona calisaya TaxID=153742 RepID=A0ABD2ZAX1_9GENT
MGPHILVQWSQLVQGTAFRFEFASLAGAASLAEPEQEPCETSLEEEERRRIGRNFMPVIDVTPVNYTFEVNAMSAEKLSFLPAVFTIGPRVDDDDSLVKYAKLLSHHKRESDDVKELGQGVIEGETRVLAASMTMEEIFRGCS